MRQWLKKRHDNDSLRCVLSDCVSYDYSVVFTALILGETLHCVSRIVYCVLSSTYAVTFWGQLRIAYCVLRIAQQIRSLILGRAVYCVLRIAYCVL